MLNARCSNPPWRNAYVTSCHGANDAPTFMPEVAMGHRASGTMICGAMLCSRNRATLATISAVVAGGIGIRGRNEMAVETPPLITWGRPQSHASLPYRRPGEQRRLRLGHDNGIKWRLPPLPALRPTASAWNLPPFR